MGRAHSSRRQTHAGTEVEADDVYGRGPGGCGRCPGWAKGISRVVRAPAVPLLTQAPVFRLSEWHSAHSGEADFLPVCSISQDSCLSVKKTPPSINLNKEGSVLACVTAEPDVPASQRRSRWTQQLKSYNSTLALSLARFKSFCGIQSPATCPPAPNSGWG